MSSATTTVDQANIAKALELARGVACDLRKRRCQAEVVIDANGWPSVVITPPAPIRHITFTCTVDRDQ